MMLFKENNTSLNKTDLIFNFVLCGEAPEIFLICPDVDSSCVEYAFTVRYLLLQENLKDTFYYSGKFN
jgi:hypothetical protein